MRLYLPTNPWWYIAVIVLFGPFFAVHFGKPEWLIRFISISVLDVTGIVAFLAHGLSKRIQMSEWRMKNPPLQKYISKEKVLLSERIFLTTCGVAFIFILLPPLIKDGITLINGEAPIMTEGLVTYTRGSLQQEVVLNNAPAGPDTSFSAWYFAPRHIMQGNTYEFLYLPNTRWILEARLVKEGSK